MAPKHSNEWKDRFTEKQLERKRQVDRVGQRRTREQLKRTVTDLAKRVELLSQAHGNVIIERLLAENDQLKERLNDCRNKISSIQQLSQECFDDGDDLQQVPASPKRYPREDDATAKATKSLEASLNSLSKDLPFFSAILFCRTSRSEAASSPGSVVFTDSELLDLIMSWKLSAQHSLGFDFLLGCLGLDREPLLLTSKHVLDRVRSKGFYDAIVCSLNASETDPSPFADLDSLEPETLPEMECQRRAVALCAYEITTRWQKLFASSLEYHAQFWGLYRLFMLLSFPGEDNIKRTPIWMRPSRSQLTYPHPGFIDCIMWPKIRDFLLHSWHRHNSQAFSVAFVRSLSVDVHDKHLITKTLIVGPNGNSIELDPTFAAAISRIENFRLGDDFLRLFPEVASFLKESLMSDGSAQMCHPSATEVGGHVIGMGNGTSELSNQTSSSCPENTQELPTFEVYDVNTSLSVFGDLDFDLYPMPVQGTIFSAANLALTPDMRSLERVQTFSFDSTARAL